MHPSSQRLDTPDVSTHAAQEMLHRARQVEPGHYDELRDASGRLRESWQQFADHLDAPLDDLTRRQELLARQIQEDGVTYNVYNAQTGPSRPWSLEPLPLIVSAQDWQALASGIAQRARLLNAVLHDVYGAQSVLRQALLPSALVLGHPGYLRGLQGVKPAGDVYLHIVAFDLVRGPDGQWWVVSQRTQAPSGLGYVMQNRLMISRLFPDAYRAMNVQHLASAYRRVLDTLTNLASNCAMGQTPRLALWTPGPYNETYFEHAYLARYLGLPLVEGGDLVVRDEGVYLKTVQGLEPVHGLLRRLDDGFCDPLELRPDSTLGLPGLMQAVRAGRVVLANALGTGFLESPAVHGFLPALSRHLLQEDLSLPSLPTWWCGEAAAWQAVQAQLVDKVIRGAFPADSTRGVADAVVLRHLSAEDRQHWRARLDADPASYAVQAFMPYAHTPVWADQTLRMRGASLRVYALADGQGGWQVLPGGMTRIARHESGPVSMQLGGSSLDTWVLTDEPVDTFSMLPSAVRPDELMLRQRPVASRVAEHLFWMGRYTERIEQQLRLVQSLLSLQAGDDDPDETVLRALTELSRAHGLVPPGTPGLHQSPRVFERAVLDALTDDAAGHGAHSLGFNLAALSGTAQTLRERLSPAHARLLRTMQEDFHRHMQQGVSQTEARAAGEGREARCAAGSQHAHGLAFAHEALECLAMQLAAVTGAQSDRMTRDAGWRLLTVGRLIERLSGHATILKVFWAEQALHSPQGFDMVLDLFDSAITFRARFQRRLETPALLALLVMDESNPRALACVLRRLRTEIGKLPERGGAHEALLAWLPHQGVGVSLADLCDPAVGHQAVKAMLNRLVDAGWHLSDDVGRRYFAHAEQTGSMVSA